MYILLLFSLSCTGDNSVKTYNEAPTALITSHSDGFALEEGTPVEFRAQISDSNHATEDLLANWHMNNLLVCDWAAADSNGTSYCTITPELGASRISVTATDPEDAAGVHEIAIQVYPSTTIDTGDDNEAPQVQISNPQDQDIYLESDSIQFSAMVLDDQDSSEQLTLLWSSSLTGIFNQDPATSSGFVNAEASLSAGEHLITLTAYDQNGAQGSDTITLIVEEDEPPPTFSCEISSPADGSLFLLGSSITFEAAASSNADISIYDYQFTSDRDGVLDFGTIPVGGIVSFSDTGLSENTHLISFDIKNLDDSVLCQASITLNVEAPLVPSGNIVFVTSQRHTGNFGGVTGADSLCQSLANSAGLAGTFKAWLSGSSVSSSPSARFSQSSAPYLLVDGTVIANNWGDLTDGSIQNPINLDEAGNPASTSMVYSYTRNDGTPGLFGSPSHSCYGGDCHCNDWTNANGQGSPTPGSAVGQTTQTGNSWTDYSFGNFCGPTGYPVYCFEQ